jgi:hypothetical protein
MSTPPRGNPKSGDFSALPGKTGKSRPGSGGSRGSQRANVAALAAGNGASMMLPAAAP